MDTLLALKRSSEHGQGSAESLRRWILADPWDRKISPLSALSVPDYVRQLLSDACDPQIGLVCGRDEAERLFPGHPLLGAPKRAASPEP